MTDRWQRVEAIFHATLGRRSVDREAFLADACAGDDALRTDVESLLRNADLASQEHFMAGGPIARASLVGRHLGAYEIEAFVGAGGMGEVYRARDTRLRRSVALKLLPTQLFADEDRVRRFEREALAASALNHPNIVTIHEIGHADGLHFIAQEFIEGQTLRERMSMQRLSIAEVLAIAAQISTALDAAHAAGVIHRDIKPDNVMVRSDGYVKVLDFGLAKVAELIADGDPDAPTVRDVRTKSGLILGTTRYMSPEQARGLPVDARSDLFSLGILLYEMLAGRAPFDGATSTDVLAAIVAEEPPPLAGQVRALPAELDRIVSKLLRKTPDERYQSAREVTVDLNALRTGLTSSRRPPVARDRKGPSRRTVARTAAILGIGLAIALVVYSRQTPALSERDTVLLTDFVNSTGDPVFDGSTLKQGLAIQLRQTPFLNLVADEAVRTALTTMARPPDTPVTAQIGREICQRQGLKALVTGSIARLGTQYVVTVEALNAHSGESLAIEQAQASDQEHVLQALSQAAIGLRRKLGESLGTLQKYNAPIEQATTSSLEALRAYSSGLELLYSEKGRAALPFFKRAVEIDPQFVAAYDNGAWAHAIQGDVAGATTFAELGYRHRDRGTEREKLSAAATYQHFGTNDHDEENKLCEVWKRLYPNDWVPHACLALNYLFPAGRFEDAITEAREIIRLSPNVAQGYRFLAPALVSLGRYDEALKVSAQAQARNLDNLFQRAARYRIAVVRGDETARVRVLEEIRQHEGETDAVTWQARTALSRGQFREARSFYERVGRPIDIARVRGLAGLCDPASPAGKGTIAPAGIPNQFFTPAVFFVPAVTADGALCADSGEADRFVETFLSRFPKSTLGLKFSAPLFRAAAALRQSQPDRAIAALQPMSTTGGALYWPNYLRGQALLRLGRGAAAAAEFRTIIDHRGWDPVSALYGLAHLGLARAAEVSGDVSAARRAYEAFFAFWKDADADAPVMIEARRGYEKIGSK